MAYVLEAAVRLVVVETEPTGAAFGVSKVMPYVVAAILGVWTFVAGRRAKQRAEALDQAERAASAEWEEYDDDRRTHAGA